MKDLGVAPWTWVSEKWVLQTHIILLFNGTYRIYKHPVINTHVNIVCTSHLTMNTNSPIQTSYVTISCQCIFIISILSMNTNHILFLSSPYNSLLHYCKALYNAVFCSTFQKIPPHTVATWLLHTYIQMYNALFYTKVSDK